jgi:hypothetical protein
MGAASSAVVVVLPLNTAPDLCAQFGFQMVFASASLLNLMAYYGLIPCAWEIRSVYRRMLM